MEFINEHIEFEIILKIAEGGQGAVYKALQKGVEGFKKTVAIKTMLKEQADQSERVTSFIEEAKLVANLVHENIVQIYHLGQTGKSYYFVLEFVNGISLFEFLLLHNKLKFNLPVELAVYIASRIARGLAYAHSRIDSNGRPLNIVHCDVCPHNILITSEGLPKLTDFGIAKARSIGDKHYSITGKVPFMSPEQASGKELDYRSDIYSLGAVLFNMLTNDHVRDTSNDFNTVLKHAREGTVRWELLSEDIGPDLNVILRKMLAVKPEERYQSTDELGRELEYYIYKDGYGPTIVTLSNYMHKQLPGYFVHGERVDTKVTTEIRKTEILDESEM